MRIPVVRGIIDRRILLNYRVDPEILADMLPVPFRPQLVGGHGLAGVCLIRLKHVRPRFLPRFVGLTSENAAHRIAVEWEENGRMRSGVYIPRRDTSSRLNTFLGGRLFPGFHHHARFRCEEKDGRYDLAIDSDDRELHIALRAAECTQLPDGSIFHSIEDASRLFYCGSIGYSPTRKEGSPEGLELRTFGWNFRPLMVASIKSSFFDDLRRFPPGTVEFDSAFLMRGIEHEWHSVSKICSQKSDSPMRQATIR